MKKLHRLWRGKRTDTLEWAEFDIAETAARKGEIGFKVTLETLGQCVGFVDKNRKPIFEDDIVTYKSTSGKKWIGQVFYSVNKSRFVMKVGSGQTFEIARKYANCYEVIGNIHDNPVLADNLNKEGEEDE